MPTTNAKGKNLESKKMEPDLPHSPLSRRASLIKKFRRGKKVETPGKNTVSQSYESNLSSPIEDDEFLAITSPFKPGKFFTSDSPDIPKGSGTISINLDWPSEMKGSLSTVQRACNKMKKLKRLSFTYGSSSEDLRSVTSESPTPSKDESEPYFPRMLNDRVKGSPFGLERSFLSNSMSDLERTFNAPTSYNTGKTDGSHRKYRVFDQGDSFDGKSIPDLSDYISNKDHLHPMKKENLDSKYEPISTKKTTRSSSAPPVSDRLSRSPFKPITSQVKPAFPTNDSGNSSSFEKGRNPNSYSTFSIPDMHLRTPLHLRSQRFMSVDDVTKPKPKDKIRKYSEVPKTGRVKERQAMLTSSSSDKKLERISRTQREVRKKSIANAVQEKKSIYTKKEKEMIADALVINPVEAKRNRHPSPKRNSPKRVNKLIRKLTPSFNEEKLLKEAVNEQDANALEKLLITNDNKDETKINFLFPPGISLLHQACYLGNLEIVTILVDQGANLELKTYRKLSPLVIAVLFGHFTIAEYLIQCGADDSEIKDGVPLHELSKLENRN